jgi:hypothetical protein
MGLKFRRGSTAQQSGSLAFGEPYVNTTLGTLVVGGATGDIVLSTSGTGSTGNFGAISGSGLDITGNANIAGNLTLGGQLTIGDNTSDTVNVVASLSSSLIPQTDNVFDLGSATKSWRDLYISTGSIKFVANGAVVSTLSTNADGSQNFPNGVNITGSLIVSGSNVEFTRDWPEVGSESHFLRLTPFTSSTGRYYDGLGIGVEHWQDESGIYEHSLQIHSWDNHDNPNYGAELNVGPYRTHMKIYPSGSNGNIANISVQEFLNNGTTAAKIYADSVQIGVVLAESIIIGNTGSLVVISGSTQITSITGSLSGNASTATTLATARTINGTSFNGSADITIANLVSGSSQIDATATTNFATGVKTQLNSNTVVSGSSQVTLSSTTGYGSVLNQAVLTTSSPTFTGLTINGAITATGDITAYYTSDKRHKHNIVLISDALSKVTKLNGVTWEWNDDVNEVTKSTPKTGLIAQEVQEVLPEVVREREDGFLALDYSKMMGLMVEAIKEQQKQIDSLLIKINQLENK